MPRISNLEKLQKIALAKLDSVYKLIHPKKYTSLRSRVLAARGPKRGPEAVNKILEEIIEISSVKETLGNTSNKKITNAMISEAKKIKSTPTKTLYKFVVNVLQTTVLKPVSHWMNPRYFNYGKKMASGQRLIFKVKKLRMKMKSLGKRVKN